MPPLVPIGRFAHRTGLTIKALRLYDKVGLLRPRAIQFSIQTVSPSLAHAVQQEQQRYPSPETCGTWRAG